MNFQKRALQGAVLIFGFVPVLAGLYCGLTGASASDLSLDNHFRYLSGLLFAIGIAFWCCIPRIETKGAQVRLLTVIVFSGGLFRLYGWIRTGFILEPTIYGPLVMELIVTPLLCLWQSKISKA